MNNDKKYIIKLTKSELELIFSYITEINRKYECEYEMALLENKIKLIIDKIGE